MLILKYSLVVLLSLTGIRSVAQTFSNAREHVYAVKVQQPQHDWAKIYQKVESVFNIAVATFMC